MIVVQSSTDTFFTLPLLFFTLYGVTSQQQRTCGLGGGSSGGISGSGCRDRILLDNSFLITSSGILKKRKITCKQSSAQNSAKSSFQEFTLSQSLNLRILWSLSLNYIQVVLRISFRKKLRDIVEIKPPPKPITTNYNGTACK